MRKPVIAGNWKMNTTPAEGAELARAVVAGGRQSDRVVEQRRFAVVARPGAGLWIGAADQVPDFLPRPRPIDLDVGGATPALVGAL